jgi:hypothetical protein
MFQIAFETFHDLLVAFQVAEMARRRVAAGPNSRELHFEAR